MSTVKQCSNCSTSLVCSSNGGHCWCMNYPSLIAVQPNQDCLCERCLKQRVVEHIDSYCATITPEHALQNKARGLSGAAELIEEIDYYIENGLYVFTKWFHLKRGNCCKNGCRHCPYGYKK